MLLEEKQPFLEGIGFERSGSLSKAEHATHVRSSDLKSYSTPALLGHSKQCIDALRQISIFLLPSFIASRWKPTSPTEPQRKSQIHSLDGLRGLGCYCVFHDHFLRLFLSKNKPLPHILFPPFVASLFSGKGGVAIFFVISGYVLSYKALQLVRNQHFAEFQKAITSSVLRRTLRLCLPPFIAACFLCVLTAYGGFDEAWIVYEDKRRYLLLREHPPTIANSFWKCVEGLQSTQAFLLNSLIPWGQSVSFKDYQLYDVHVWTIPHELRCSMALFTLLVGTSRMIATWRILTIGILTFHVWGTRQYNAALFFAGMLLAECDLIRRSYFPLDFPSCVRIWKFKLCASPWDVFWVPIFFVGWYLHSSTIHTGPYFTFCFGTVLMIWGTTNSTMLNILFTNRTVTYLGRISYSLYLVHGGIIRSLGYVSLPWFFALATGKPLSVEQDEAFFAEVSGSQRSIAYLLGNIWIFPICIWVADIFCRVIDEPCVRLSRRFEQRVSVGDEGGTDQNLTLPFRNWLERFHISRKSDGSCCI